MLGNGSCSNPICLSEVEDEGVVPSIEDDFDFFNLEGPDPKVTPKVESEDVEIIKIRDKARPNEQINRAPIKRETSSLGAILLPWVLTSTYKISGEGILQAGTTVELRNMTAHKPGELHSGDFLRIECILSNLATDEVNIRGYRLRRTKYHGQFFDWKLNELVMILETSQDQSASPFQQGLEDIPVKEVLRKRRCTITSKPYPFLTWREESLSFPGGLDLDLITEEDLRGHLFHEGPLVCRWIHVITKQSNGNSYSGVIRSVQDKESDSHRNSQSPSWRPSEKFNTKTGEDEPNINANLRRKSKGRIRSYSIEELERPQKRRSKPPSKVPPYTFGDVFCGAGGASAGAQQAGLYVKWGLDNDKLAIQAYSSNFKDAFYLPLDAHNFPAKGEFRDIIKVDILHLSPPCCYWSPAHTREGQKDQANFEAIYTVGPILEKVKPRVATLEQTYGLLTNEQHKHNFKLLMNDILKAGYNVRYKVQDMGEFGLPQRRKRLLIIAARRGTPLPPFPKPTHGPAGSGLNRYVSVHDALYPLRTSSVQGDDYHKPDTMRRIDKKPYDPSTSMLGCITTSGGENYHPSGTRNFTVRELAGFQSFPLKYNFTGSQTDAKKQIGNAFPPIMAQAMFRTIAQTLEAYDHGIIDAEDDITDLGALLQSKGVGFPGFEPPTRSLFDTPQQRTQAQTAKYRYLRKGSRPSTPKTGRAPNPKPLFSRSNMIEAPEPEPKAKKQKKNHFFNLISDDDYDDNDDDYDGVEIVHPPAPTLHQPQKRNAKKTTDRQKKLQDAKERGDYMELSD